MILAFDTATSACSAALLSADRILARRFTPMARGQAEALAPMIQAVLAEAKASIRDLDRLAVTVGPGAFTGVRIGLATARGLALAAGLPLSGIGTLEAVAAGVGEAERVGKSVFVTLKTKRADIYAQGFSEDLRPLGPPLALMPEELAEAAPAGPLLVAGDDAPRAMDLFARAGLDCSLSVGAPLPDAAVIARLAARRAGAGDPGGPPEPVYLRPPDVTRPAPGPIR